MPYNNDIIKQDYFTIQPNYMVRYSTLEDANGNRVRFSDDSKETHKVNFVNNETYGLISDNAKKRIEKAVNYILYANRIEKPTKGKNAKYYITFITLTLPSVQTHSDNDLKKYALNHFFVEMTNHFNKDNQQKKLNLGYELRPLTYLWKAERQKNGNIHFHIIINRQVHWSIIRNKWNKILNKGTVKGCEVPFDYVDRYNARMLKRFENGFISDANIKQSIEKQKQSYYDQMRKKPADRWKNPNSTDIHKLYNIKKVHKYITKYISKDDGENVNEVLNVKDQINDTITTIKEYEKMIEDYKTQNLENLIKQYSLMIDEKVKELESLRTEINELTKNKIEGRLWFLSAKLSEQMKKNCTVADFELSEQLTKLYQYCFENQKIKQLDYCDVILLSLDELDELGFKEIKQIFDNYLII